jgi:hypothetical protein
MRGLHPKSPKTAPTFSTHTPVITIQGIGLSIDQKSQMTKMLWQQV